MAEEKTGTWQHRLQRRLKELQSVLREQGYIEQDRDKRRGLRYRLRYITVDPDGTRHRRSLYLGNAERAAYAGDWLQQIRQPKKYLLLTGLARGYSRGAMRRLAKYYDKLCSDRGEQLLFIAGGFETLREPEIRSGKRRGRQRKARLW